jgi:hypothetical protein
MVNGVTVSASVFAETTQRQDRLRASGFVKTSPRHVRLRSSSYDGTRRREKTIQTIEASLNANNIHLDNPRQVLWQD